VSFSYYSNTTVWARPASCPTTGSCPDYVER
jgi:hypothetical protein